MMYPRLQLASSLLSEDGIIFISIDDVEFANLRLIMDEIFGASNFLAACTWRGMHTVRNSSQHFNQNTEYILVYAKDMSSLFGSERRSWLRVPRDKEGDYTYDDDDGRGRYKLDPLHARNFYTPYTHVFSNGIQWAAPEGRYPAYSPESLRRMEADREIAFPGDTRRRADGSTVVYGGESPMMKRFLSNVLQGVPPDTLLPSEEVGFSRDGTAELASLFEGKVFDQPKPTKLLKYLLNIDSQASREQSKDRLVLDFFAGSCSTADAVIQLCAEGVNMRFIVVQMPEPVASDSFAHQLGYTNISEIGCDRIRRVLEKTKNTDSEASADLGFRVYRLGRSNFQHWTDQTFADPNSFLDALDNAVSPLAPKSRPEDVLVEIMLIEGFPLDSTVAPVATSTDNTVSHVSAEQLDHSLWVCLDATVHDATVDALAFASDDVFICLDSALSDTAKIALTDRTKLRTI